MRDAEAEIPRGKRWIEEDKEQTPKVFRVLLKFLKFIGPGIIVSVAYMDPGNYSTSVAAGAQYKYTLLFSIFVSNIFAVVLQCLCVKLGTVTGHDLAESCRLYLPKYVNYTLYAFAQLAIVATDLAEVIGTAIALNILFNIPLIYGVLITILDVLVILFLYNPKNHSMKQTRIFETIVSILVAATCGCFVWELFKVNISNYSEVWKGFIPDAVIFQDKQALYISLGILGATVMPHSLYLGSALVKPRIYHYELKTYGEVKEKPSVKAIDFCLNYSYAELVLSLFFIATFVNSAILIVAGATLFGEKDAADADLISIYKLLVQYVSSKAGLVFAIAMLLSGFSAGIICTLAGQIVSEGFLEWSLTPWATRLITRSIAIVPCLFVTLALGENGIARMLNFSQVCLSLILPIVSAPLLYFTSSAKYMVIREPFDESESTPLTGTEVVRDYTNSTTLTTVSILIWGLIASLNCYLIFSYLLGADVHF